MKSKVIIVMLALNILGSSCNRVTPASFWLNFQNNLISSKESDQGPWGGNREVVWKGKSSFDTKDIIGFAKKNDWDFVDSILLSNDVLTDNSFYDLDVDEHSIEILKTKILPVLKSKENTILIFKTAWVLHPGYDTDETFQNGFAILTSTRTELKVLHFWGE